MPTTRSVVAAVAAAVLVTGIALVGPAQAASTTKVNVLLSEFIVRPKPKSVEAGKIPFVARNVGVETHEFVIARASSPDALPTDADGAVDETQIPAEDLIGEIEDVASQKMAKGTFTLKAGKYVLFCNIVDEEATGEKVAHFAEGMHKKFTVTKP
jgi:hypothetical protein